MPRLVDAIELPDEEVIQLLTELPTSQYYRAEPRFLNTIISVQIARRVLYTLIIQNDREKANFRPIMELNSVESSSLFQSLNPDESLASLSLSKHGSSKKMLLPRLSYINQVRQEVSQVQA